MKAAFALLIVVGFAGCSKARTAPPSSGASAGQMGKVYFQGTGSEQETRRFQKILEIALDDNDLQRVDSSKDADAVVKATITRRETTTHIRVPRLLVTLVSRDNKKYELEECHGMSTADDIYSNKAEYVAPFELPQDWTAAHPHFAIYIDESKFNGYEELIASFKQRLMDKGYKVASEASASDGELSTIRMQRLEVPMRVMNREVEFVVFDKDGRRYYSNAAGEATDITYLGVEPPLKLETLPCREQVKSFKTFDIDGSSRDAHGIARTISENIGKTVVHSN
jgi:hypothetical protein